MTFLKNYSSTDRKLILVAILGILICLYFLLFGDSRSDIDRSSDIKIGTVEKYENDTRQKPNGLFVWEDISKNQKIYAGDTVYSGRNSHLTLQLNNGSSVTIDENSMVTFEILDGQSKIDIENGNFQLKVLGRAKISNKGQVTEVNGSLGPIAILFKKGKAPEVKKHAQSLDQNKNGIKIDPVLKSDSQQYVWRLYDRYQKTEYGLRQRIPAPISVKASQTLSWDYVPVGEVTIQHSRFANFDESVIYTSENKSYQIREVFVGKNYWRASANGGGWLPPQQFEFLPILLPNSGPIPGTRSSRIPIVSSELQLRIPLTSPVEAIGFITQISKSQQFPPDQTRSIWSATTDIKLTFKDTGSYYLRFQGVNKSQQLTEWSEIVNLDLFRASAPLAPIAEEDRIKRFVGEKVDLSWRSNPARTKIEIYDKKNRLVKKLSGNQFTWIAKSAGVFKARAYQVNEFGQKSPASKTSIVEILPLTAALSQETANKQERKPAFTDNTLRSDYKMPKYRYLNDNYKSNQFAIQGMLWTIQSTEQSLANEAAPFATGLAAHGYYWKGSHGFEGTVKSGIIGLNDTGSEGTSLKSFEPRYHYRFITRSPFKFTPELMYSLFMGYELYRNSATSISNRYDLLKFGTMIEFPVSKRWATGGEFVFGLGLESSKKFEVSGNLHYFFDPEWSFGGGYRLHMFEAASSSASPSGLLPYREGYTEGFSTLNYYF